MSLKKLSVIVAAIGSAASAAFGQDTYAFTVNQPLSTITSDFSAMAPFAGTFIGNYDAESNPGGTRTLLGALGFCSAGNQAVSYTGSGGATGNPMTNPTGTFILRIDTVADRAVLYALSVDLLGGTEPTIATEGTMTYQGFRTCNPTGFFPSLDVPLPLEDAVITRLTATQTCAPSIGVIKNINPGEYTFSIPTMVTVDPGVNFNGEDQKTKPIEVAVTLEGTVLLGDVAAMATARLTVDYGQEIEGPIVAADDAPFDLPNPLGGTVHLLLDLTLESVTIDLSANAVMQANGMVTTTPCAADWNSDDTVNSQDFFDFLTSFFGGAADFNCSGVTNSQDFFDFLSAFFGGC